MRCSILVLMAALRWIRAKVRCRYLLFEEAYVRLLVELGRRQQHARQLEKLAADFARISAKLAAGTAAWGVRPWC